MQADLIIESPLWSDHPLQDLADAATIAIKDVLQLPELTEADFCILACDDAKIATLNQDFRDKAKATNVLSWPSEERAAEIPGGPPLPPNDLELGDIAIAFETCEREAQEQRKPFHDHVSHLLIHGVLHLLGYDHINETDAELMEQLEVDILEKLSISDPYRE